MSDLNLSGLPLTSLRAQLQLMRRQVRLLREQERGLARFIKTQDRNAYRAILDLLDQGLIEECGMHAPARGYARAIPHRAREAAARHAGCPDEPSELSARKGNELSRVAARTPEDTPADK